MYKQSRGVCGGVGGYIISSACELGAPLKLSYQQKNPKCAEGVTYMSLLLIKHVIIVFDHSSLGI